MCRCFGAGWVICMLCCLASVCFVFELQDNDPQHPGRLIHELWSSSSPMLKCMFHFIYACDLCGHLKLGSNGQPAQHTAWYAHEQHLSLPLWTHLDEELQVPPFVVMNHQINQNKIIKPSKLRYLHDPFLSSYYWSTQLSLRWVYLALPWQSLDRPHQPLNRNKLEWKMDRRMDEYKMIPNSVRGG